MRCAERLQECRVAPAGGFFFAEWLVRLLTHFGTIIMATTPSKPPVITTTTPPPRVASAVKDPAYWQALGKFIEAFAFAETLLFNYLAALSGTSHAISRALFGSDHADTLIDAVRRVRATLPPDDDLMNKTELALTQFKLISRTRNSVVHYVSIETSDKGRISSNITRARQDKLIVEYRASVAALEEMTIDLERVAQTLLYCQLVDRI